MVAFNLNGVVYYYQINSRGDITGIYDTNGTLVVQYTYDAWGNLTGITGSMADTVGQMNPLRYRGYYYDVETGFYYLQSRHYDPAVGRFISVDGFVSTGQGLLQHNMFAYCNNNPIMFSDPSGHCSIVGNTVYICSLDHYNRYYSDKSKYDIYKTYYYNGRILQYARQKPVVAQGGSGNNDAPYYGDPGSHATSPDGTKERVYGDNGKPDRDRHHTDHGHPKQHPKIPHDHDWVLTPDGKWEPGPAYPSPDGPLRPREKPSLEFRWDFNIPDTGDHTPFGWLIDFFS